MQVCFAAADTADSFWHFLNTQSGHSKLILWEMHQPPAGQSRMSQFPQYWASLRDFGHMVPRSFAKNQAELSPVWINARNWKTQRPSSFTLRQSAKSSYHHLLSYWKSTQAVQTSCRRYTVHLWGTPVVIRLWYHLGGGAVVTIPRRLSRVWTLKLA